MQTEHVTESPLNRCPQCGTPLQARSLGGLCPACLLKQGVTAETAGAAPFEAPRIEDLKPLFPRLTILELLGKGGMGAVYKARQTDLDRVVALKIVPRGDTGQAATERFAREARALARLSHPNIVAVHEFGTAGDFHFFIMEFVDGLNLRELNKRQRLSPREALQVIPQICDALQYAHDQGVVHRDIKPENVLIDRGGRVKIADFGIAKLTEAIPAAEHLTAEGQTMGTPHYMAPEQVEHPRDVDHRADIFSLGVVFYELLTGELPLGKFSAPSRRVQVDVRLDEVVLRALEKDPERRYQQAGDVKTAVETIAHSAPPAIVTNSTREIASAGFHGKVALALFIAGTLGTLVLSAVSHRDEYALAFAALALLAALGFGIASRRHRLGKVIVIATLVIFAGVLITVGILSEVIPIPGRAAKSEQARAQAMAAAEKAKRAAEENRRRNWSPESTAGVTPDPEAIHREARDLMAKSEYEGALVRHIWYHNHAVEYEPSLSAVRLSFALSDWAELARRYPPAKAELIRIRDEKTREIAAGRGYFGLFYDVFAINRELGQDAATLELFKTVEQVDPILAKQFSFVLEPLRKKMRAEATNP